MFVALTRRSIARLAGILAGVALMLTGLQVLIVVIAATQERAQSFDLLAQLAPAFIQRSLGATLPTFLSFGGLVSFGYFHPVVVLSLSLVAALVATELAADVENGHVDLLLARPVARHWLVTRSLVAALGSATVLVLMMVIASRLALAAFAPAGSRWPDFSRTNVMAAHLLAVAWCFGALGLAASAVARRRMNAMGPVAIAAVSLYLLEVLGSAWAPIAPAAAISPFHYYQGAPVLGGTSNSVRDLAVLGSMTLMATAVAYWRFGARDL